jgi:hypothetical protein
MTAPRRAPCRVCGWALLLCAAFACSSASTTPTDRARADAAPVELSLVSAEGRRFGLAQLRGRPLLLFVFTTYDQASQLALTPLVDFLRGRDDLNVLGIAAQPGAGALLPLYRDALAVPFPLAYEAEAQIVAGNSMLGPIETVPTYVLLDAEGRIAARHTGALTDRELEELVDPVVSR